jgi:hypothetical protein
MRLIPLLYVLVVAIAWLGYRASHASTRLLVPDALSRRVLFDAIGICLGIAVGSRLLTLFAGTEGLVSMRMETELALAHAIRQLWFRRSRFGPPISISTANPFPAQTWAGI